MRLYQARRSKGGKRRRWGESRGITDPGVGEAGLDTKAKVFVADRVPFGKGRSQATPVRRLNGPRTPSLSELWVSTLWGQYPRVFLVTAPNIYRWFCVNTRFSYVKAFFTPWNRFPAPPGISSQLWHGHGIRRVELIAGIGRSAHLPGLGRVRHTQSPHAAGSAVFRPGQARHPHLRQWRALSRRHLRSQALARSLAWQGDPHPPQHRAQDRCRVAVALQVQKIRTERHRGQRALREDGRLH